MSDEAVVTLLTRTNELLAILVKTELRDVMEKELTDPKRRKLYELTGGTLTIRELSIQLGMSTGAISLAWQKWDDVGLLTKRNGKYRRTLE